MVSSQGKGSAGPRPGLASQDIIKITGPIDPAKIAEIMAARPTAEELEEAVAWAAGASDVMGELRRPLAGTVARLYDILTADRGFEEME